MGFVDEATGGIETEELGGEASVFEEEFGGDEFVEADSMVEGLDLEAGFEEGGEDLGFDFDAAVDSGLDVIEDVIEGFQFRLGLGVLVEEERSWR